MTCAKTREAGAWNVGEGFRATSYSMGSLNVLGRLLGKLTVIDIRLQEVLREVHPFQSLERVLRLDCQPVAAAAWKLLVSLGTAVTAYETNH